MTGKASRRSFLKGGPAAACNLAALTLPVAASEEKDESRQPATSLDIDKCDRGKDCVEAYAETSFPKYTNPQKPFPKTYPSRFMWCWTGKKRKPL